MRFLILNSGVEGYRCGSTSFNSDKLRTNKKDKAKALKFYYEDLNLINKLNVQHMVALRDFVNDNPFLAKDSSLDVIFGRCFSAYSKIIPGSKTTTEEFIEANTQEEIDAKDKEDTALDVNLYGKI